MDVVPAARDEIDPAAPHHTRSYCPYFYVTYFTWTYSILPLNLNGALSP
jgi:hypothetical protein